jgi:hypothetical protein
VESKSAEALGGNLLAQLKKENYPKKGNQESQVAEKR